MTNETRGRAEKDCGCDKAKAELEEYLHRELSSHDFDVVTAHLEGCEDCSGEHRVGLTLTEKLQRSCREQTPEQLRAAILAKLDGAQR